MVDMHLCIVAASRASFNLRRICALYPKGGCIQRSDKQRNVIIQDFSLKTLWDIYNHNQIGRHQ
jgi:hypothetical protein